MTKENICSICGLEIDTDQSGWDGGHNAQPVNNGRCCSKCNYGVVLPRRLTDVGFSRQSANKIGLEIRNDIDWSDLKTFPGSNTDEG